MTTRRLSVAFGVFLTCALSGRIACAQQPPTAETLQKQIDALRLELNAVQKDLQEIKALLAPLKAPQGAQPQTVVLDPGNRPFRGARTAKLTLVEFTDYQ